MTNFHSLRDFCLRLFGAPNLSAEHIVDIWVEDAASMWPHGSEGVCVAFTLTYPGLTGWTDRPTQPWSACWGPAVRTPKGSFR